MAQHLVLLHGYLLHGTGSNIYVSNIAQSWRAQGHAVTVICQDRTAKNLPFVDQYVGPSDAIPDRSPEPGRVRVVVPFVGDLLPVYVMDRYPGYLVKTVVSMTGDEIEAHIQMTASALEKVSGQGVDRVLANHAILSPVIARRALEGRAVPYDVKIHGSSIEYALVPCPRLMSYAVEGLGGAARVFVGSGYIKDRMMEVFSAQREAIGLDHKLAVVPPGMDPDLFKPIDDFSATQTRFKKSVEKTLALNNKGRRHHIVPGPEGATPEAFHRTLVELADRDDQRVVDADLLEKWPRLRENEPIILYFGKFLGAKGVGELLLTVPTVLLRFPQVRFIFVGYGTYREHLEGMIQALASGDRASFAAFAQAGDFLDPVDFDRWFRRLSAQETGRITVTGMLDHAELSHLLPLASLSIVPSKVPEAFGMVAVEAMAAGVLPLCNDFTGLRAPIDVVRQHDPELADLMGLDRDGFVNQLPDKIQAALEYLYPNGMQDSHVRKAVGERLRLIAVNEYAWGRIARRLLA